MKLKISLSISHEFYHFFLRRAPRHTAKIPPLEQNSNSNSNSRTSLLESPHLHSPKKKFLDACVVEIGNSRAQAACNTTHSQIRTSQAPVSVACKLREMGRLGLNPMLPMPIAFREDELQIGALVFQLKVHRGWYVTETVDANAFRKLRRLHGREQHHRVWQHRFYAYC